jgi:hypothetical protein
MYALTWRELALIGRSRPFWAATIVYLGLLFLFVLLWGDGLPIVNGGTSWEQFSSLQWAALTVLFPWTAARCAAPRRRELALLAVTTGAAPSRLLLARSIAVAIALLSLAIAALPVMLLMQQVAAMPLASIASATTIIAGLAAFAAVITSGCMAISTHPLKGWIAATAITVAAALFVPRSAAATPLWLIAAVMVVIPLLWFADSRLRYLPEEFVG